MDVHVNDTQLKSMIKESLVELLRDNREEMVELISEALEDFGLGKAIEAGRKKKYASESEILQILEGQG